jgi:endonuclease/exonuclease/phosphatase (EEP) superfamily protein YafD
VSDPERPIERQIRRLLVALAIGVAVATLAAALMPLHPLFELLSHFRHWYAAGAMVAAAGLLYLGRPRMAVPAAVALVWNLWFVAPWYAGESAASCPSGVELRLLSANMLKSNADAKPLRQLVDRENPDIVLLSEYSRGLQRRLSGLHSTYPHRFEETRGHLSGVAIFSRHPLSETRLEAFGAEGPPQLHTTVTVEGRTIDLWGVHPLPPVGPQLMAERDKVLDGLGEATATSDRPVIAIGDLNTTMWSPVYGRLAAHGLQNARHGRGLQGTWPAIPFFPLKLPIDHALHTDELKAVSFEVGQSIGSDHLPILADFCLPKTGS